MDASTELTSRLQAISSFSASAILALENGQGVSALRQIHNILQEGGEAKKQMKQLLVSRADRLAQELGSVDP